VNLLLMAVPVLVLSGADTAVVSLEFCVQLPAVVYLVLQ
jgi:hypothetical protein